MAARATWKGLLQISRVTIPIKVFPATAERDKLAFNQLHEPCQTRVTQRKWCVQCAREVAANEIVKGFEFARGQFVVLLDDELDAVKPPSTRVIDLVQFAKETALDPLYVNRSYYLAPDGPQSADAFAVFSAAMAGMVGIGKVALYGREFLVAVRRLSGGAFPVLLLHTLHHAAEIRAHEADVVGTAIAEVKLARQVIGALTGPLNLANFTDEHQGNLHRLIDAKIAGNEIVAVVPLDVPTIGNFKDALLASLRLEAAKPRSVKAAPAKQRRTA